MLNTEQEKHAIADAASDAIKAIAAAKEAANRDIAIATAEASRVVLTKADQTAKTLTVGNANDHDFLLTFASEVRTKLDGLVDQVKKLDDGLAKRIDTVEKEKLNTCDSYPVLYKEGVETTLKDHEKRIKSGEITDTRLISYGTALIFIIGIVEFILSNYFSK